jgi:hypothetical protein
MSRQLRLRSPSIGSWRFGRRLHRRCSRMISAGAVDGDNGDVLDGFIDAAQSQDAHQLRHDQKLFIRSARRIAARWDARTAGLDLRLADIDVDLTRTAADLDRADDELRERRGIRPELSSVTPIDGGRVA